MTPTAPTPPESARGHIARVTARSIPEAYHGAILVGAYPAGEVAAVTQCPIVGRTILYTSVGLIDIPDGCTVAVDAQQWAQA